MTKLSPQQCWCREISKSHCVHTHRCDPDESPPSCTVRSNPGCHCYTCASDVLYVVEPTCCWSSPSSFVLHHAFNDCFLETPGNTAFNILTMYLLMDMRVGSSPTKSPALSSLVNQSSGSGTPGSADNIIKHDTYLSKAVHRGVPKKTHHFWTHL